MAKIDYNDLDYCKRIILKKDVQSLNKIVSGLTQNLEYIPNVFFERLVENFKDRIKEEDFYLEGKKVSPVVFFDLNTLNYYKHYLQNVVSHFSVEKPTHSSDFFEVVIEEAKKIREKARKEGNLLAFNKKHEQPILNYITDSQYNKALKSIRTQEPDFNKNYDYIDKTTELSPNYAKQSIYSTQTQELKDRLSDLDYRLEEILHDKHVAEVQIGDLTERKSDLRYEIKAAGSTVAAMADMQEFKKITAELDELKSDVDHYNTNIKQIETEITTINRELDERDAKQVAKETPKLEKQEQVAKK